MEQLLIIEDDIGLNQGLCKALKADDRQIISCHDLKAAREQLLCGGVSLILLDINLPDGSGLELLREVKENMPGVPVILLTANDTDLDIVDGLERGADDYITKPFGMMEFVARVKAVLRRSARQNEDKELHYDELYLNVGRHEVRYQEEKVDLTRKEFELLQYLMENKGLVMTRNQILCHVWGYDFDGETRTVDVHVRTLRQKLGEAGNLIETVRGVGYRIGA
mgnify:CR=1 FL=1